MLRIIGGTYKHRLIDQPSLETTRATKDAAKEGLFNSLGDISNKSFLDLFSGSGAIGIEAYSRGAKPVYLNDRDNDARRIIQKNLISLAIFDCNVTGLDYKDCLNNISQKGVCFDYVFLDPPYKFKIDNDFILNLINLKLVNEKSVIIIESDEKIEESAFIEYNIKVLKYGKTFMNILRRKSV